MSNRSSCLFALKVISSIAGHFGLFGGEGEDYHGQIDRYLKELLAVGVPEGIKELEGRHKNLESLKLENS